MRILVIGEIALAIVVVTSMARIGQSFIRLTHVTRGYDTKDVVIAAFVLPNAKYHTQETRRNFWFRLLEELDHERTVAFPAVSSGLPIIGGTTAQVSAPDLDPVKSIRASVWTVTANYFRSLGVPVVRGAGQESAFSGDGIVIDTAAAEALFGTHDVVGRRIVWAKEKKEGVVSAVVGPIQDLSVSLETNSTHRIITPHIYVSALHDVPAVVRVSGRALADPGRALQSIRETIARIDPEIPVGALDTFDGVIRTQLVRERFLVVIVLALPL